MQPCLTRRLSHLFIRFRRCRCLLGSFAALLLLLLLLGARCAAAATHRARQRRVHQPAAHTEYMEKRGEVQLSGPALAPYRQPSAWRLRSPCGSAPSLPAYRPHLLPVPEQPHPPAHEQVVLKQAGLEVGRRRQVAAIVHLGCRQTTEGARGQQGGMREGMRGAG